ncbi:MAG: DUF6263 family protein [Planctomycetota bacterium]
MKGKKLKAPLLILTTFILSFLPGCKTATEEDSPPETGELLTVDFQAGQTLRYKFVSSREITVEWDTTAAKSRPGRPVSDKSSESLEIIMSYTPIEVDPYGLTKIKATCESVKVARSKGPGKDAVDYLTGKTFTLAVGPTGKIEDYSQLDELLKEIGKKAFRPNTDIKEPDMISDVVATQWFLWDAVSSIKNPSRGAAVGDSWTSKLSVPTPMVMRKARDVTYRLDEIRPGEKGRLAVISSSYRISDSAPRQWPIPYSGRFQVAGAFGFYRNYKVIDLQGKGQELFNIDAGRTEQYNQQYQLQLSASLLMPLAGVNPKITIRQNLTMNLLED